MVFCFRLRDFFIPRRKVLKEAGIEPGFVVLDYGSGPGGYVLATSKLVGPLGAIYSLDKNDHALAMVRDIASKHDLRNVKTIHSDCETGLDDGGVDVVLFYDTLHTISKSERVLKELYRVLKADGLLSCSDHHMTKDDIVSRICEGGLFRLLRSGKKTHTFARD
ncbi:MAG: class I SAM-dependent methyltransferase [Candidatus Coatesbacteria bacterium]|nr:class I SAM-dependent methyltransferase [Candidatus Coatesbacteria bacterium]